MEHVLRLPTTRRSQGGRKAAMIRNQSCQVSNSSYSSAQYQVNTSRTYELSPLKEKNIQKPLSPIQIRRSPRKRRSPKKQLSPSQAKTISVHGDAQTPPADVERHDVSPKNMTKKRPRRRKAKLNAIEIPKEFMYIMQLLRVRDDRLGLAALRSMIIDYQLKILYERNLAEQLFLSEEQMESLVHEKMAKAESECESKLSMPLFNTGETPPLIIEGVPEEETKTTIAVSYKVPEVLLDFYSYMENMLLPHCHHLKRFIIDLMMFEFSKEYGYEPRFAKDDFDAYFIRQFQRRCRELKKHREKHSKQDNADIVIRSRFAPKPPGATADDHHPQWQKLTKHEKEDTLAIPQEFMDIFWRLCEKDDLLQQEAFARVIVEYLKRKNHEYRRHSHRLISEDEIEQLWAKKLAVAHKKYEMSNKRCGNSLASIFDEIPRVLLDHYLYMYHATLPYGCHLRDIVVGLMTEAYVSHHKHEPIDLAEICSKRFRDQVNEFKKGAAAESEKTADASEAASAPTTALVEVAAPERRRVNGRRAVDVSVALAWYDTFASKSASYLLKLPEHGARRKKSDDRWDCVTLYKAILCRLKYWEVACHREVVSGDFLTHHLSNISFQFLRPIRQRFKDAAIPGDILQQLLYYPLDGFTGPSHLADLRRNLLELHSHLEALHLKPDKEVDQTISNNSSFLISASLKMDLIQLTAIDTPSVPVLEILPEYRQTGVSAAKIWLQMAFDMIGGTVASTSAETLQLPLPLVHTKSLRLYMGTFLAAKAFASYRRKSREVDSENLLPVRTENSNRKKDKELSDLFKRLLDLRMRLRKQTEAGLSNGSKDPFSEQRNHEADYHGVQLYCQKIIEFIANLISSR